MSFEQHRKFTSSAGNARQVMPNNTHLHSPVLELASACLNAETFQRRLMEG